MSVSKCFGPVLCIIAILVTIGVLNGCAPWEGPDGVWEGETEEGGSIRFTVSDGLVTDFSGAIYGYPGSVVLSVAPDAFIFKRGDFWAGPEKPVRDGDYRLEGMMHDDMSATGTYEFFIEHQTFGITPETFGVRYGPVEWTATLVHYTEMPDVYGLSEADAVAAIESANLKVGDISYVLDDTVSSGHVLAQDPDAGEEVKEGAEAELTVAQYVIVPNVCGLAEQDAVAALESAGLTADLAMDWQMWDVEAGLVSHTVPASDGLVEPGSSVQIIVSAGQPESKTVMLPGDVPLDLVWISEGSYTMGHEVGDAIWYGEDPEPAHEVTIASGFWLSRYEVTKAQWTAVMGTTPWSGEEEVLEHPDSPAVYVSWNDAQDFVVAVNAYTGGLFRLPSEAEWEYACRAGTTTLFYWGGEQHEDQIERYAWIRSNSRYADEAYAHVTGQLFPNPWGLYDMVGNVSEWCEDDWHEDYVDAPADSSPWVDAPRAADRVERGGDYGSSDGRAASAYRGYGYSASYQNSKIGFRLVKDAATAD